MNTGDLRYNITPEQYLGELIITFIVYALRFYKVKINSSLSDSYPVLSGIPQGSVQGHCYLSYLLMIWQIYAYMMKPIYADDAKIYKHVFSKADQDQLQMSLSKLHDWSNTWLLSLNLDFGMHIAERINKAYSMLWLIKRNFKDR